MANTMVSLIISIVVLLCITSAQGRETHYELPTSSQVNNDGICKTMVEIQGYTCEEHQVTTKDGYILSLQRMPTTRSGKKADKPPVLLQHGLFTDAITWLVNNPDESLPFILADSGFDVWLVNSRGTNYSQTHKSLSPNDKAYWEWSWDELASYDLPASVEYVYKITGQKMHYAGHSQGTLMALAALSQGEVVNMLRSAALLSPIAHLNQIPSELTKLGADLFLADDVYWLGLYKFDPDLETESKFLLKLCQTLHLLDCSKLITEITGPNCCINSSRIDVYLNHKSQPTSTKNLIHLSQNQRNRSNRRSARGGSLHTGGSISTAQHRYRMEKELGRPVSAHELHRRLHTRKGTENEWVDDRSRTTQENYQGLMADFMSAQSTGMELRPEELQTIEKEKWTAAAGGHRKGRLYGVGGLAKEFRSTSSTSSFASSGGSSHHPEFEKMSSENRELRDSVAMMQKSQEQMASELQQSRKSQEDMSNKLNALLQFQMLQMQQQQQQQFMTRPLVQPNQLPLGFSSQPANNFMNFFSAVPPQSPSHLIRPQASPSHATPSGSGPQMNTDHPLSTQEQLAAASAAAMGSVDMDFFAMMGGQNVYRPQPPPDQM